MNASYKTPMRRLSVSLTEWQMKRLWAMAEAYGISVGEALRRILDQAPHGEK
jgi:hypothetical protein